MRSYAVHVHGSGQPYACRMSGFSGDLQPLVSAVAGRVSVSSRNDAERSEGGPASAAGCNDHWRCFHCELDGNVCSPHVCVFVIVCVCLCLCVCMYVLAMLAL